MAEIPGMSEGSVALKALEPQFKNLYYDIRESRNKFGSAVDTALNIGFNTKDPSVEFETVRLLGGYAALQPDNERREYSGILDSRWRVIKALELMFYKDRGDKKLSLAVIDALRSSLVFVHDEGTTHGEAISSIAACANMSYYPEVKNAASGVLGEYASREVKQDFWRTPTTPTGYNAYENVQALVNRYLKVLGVPETLIS